jgi:hypothetical protein
MKNDKEQAGTQVSPTSIPEEAKLHPGHNSAASKNGEEEAAINHKEDFEKDTSDDEGEGQE